MADGGTLFLDEINSMDMGLQGKLLKVMEEQKLRRIGDERETKVNVRVISAMNTDPGEEIAQKKLREDLYYRLGIEITLPVLAERKQDIRPLVAHFIKVYNEKTGKNIKACSEIVEKLLYSYAWPGTVSYTHLDVYKRQSFHTSISFSFNFFRPRSS